MIARHIVVLLLALCATASVATEVNEATQADLESVRGIGPVMATKLLEERAKSPFRDWDDLIARVKGLRAKSAARLSTEGLTVNGSRYPAGPADAASASN